MQFVSGATTYSEMKAVAPITVGVSGVALTTGCTPTVSKLKFFLPEICCFFSFRPNEGRARAKDVGRSTRRVQMKKAFSARDSLAGDPFSSSRAMFDSLAHLRKKVTKGHFWALLARNDAN